MIKDKNQGQCLRVRLSMYQCIVLIINCTWNFNTKREIYDLSDILLKLQNKTDFTMKYYAAVKSMRKISVN